VFRQLIVARQGRSKAMKLFFDKYISQPSCAKGHPDHDLVVLLEAVQAACKSIARAVAKGPLGTGARPKLGINVQGEDQMPLDVLANDAVIGCCEESGRLAGMVSEEMAEPYRIPAAFKRGPYLLVFDPLDGSSNIAVDMTVGTIFSVLRAPAGVTDPTVEDFLQPGLRQVAAGYALYGPATMMVLTLGAGVHGFTLDHENDAFVLTHPNLRIPEAAREFAINASNRRFWEEPVTRYVDECLEGAAGPRGIDFNMRWIASLVAEVHRILIRGGVFMYPRDSREPARPGRLRLLYEANPMAMIVEEAGGRASTGRERILEITPQSLHQRVPLILGARLEVERLLRYHEAFDSGDDVVFHAPRFDSCSLLHTDQA
jgi:fructose-1,6-bisphosphatase